MSTALRTLRHLQTPVPFWKMSGSGNDFIVVDNRDDVIPDWAKRDWSRQVCREHVAVGANGAVFIERLPPSHDSGAHVRWRYFNADGSEGEMCGNGAMCGARFVIEQGIAPNPVGMLTCGGLVRASWEPQNLVWLDMPDSGTPEMQIEIAGLPMQVTGHAVLVGVPHVVIPVDDADRWPEAGSFDAAGRIIRHHSRFAPAGVNVNVISSDAGGAMRMRTWERGVEAETLACGTGAVASAIIGTALRMVTPPVNIVTSSGCTLNVDFAMSGDRATKIRLGGGASLIATGVVMPEAWRDDRGGQADR